MQRRQCATRPRRPTRTMAVTRAHVSAYATCASFTSIDARLKRFETRRNGVTRRPGRFQLAQESNAKRLHGVVHVPRDARTRASSIDRPSTSNATTNGSHIDANALAFVDFFRQASPYIALHRGSTFVVLIPGETAADPERLGGVVRDVALLHDLGVRVVLVVGASDQVSELTRVKGGSVTFFDDYRVTDDVAMESAMEANGRNQVLVQALLSRAPTVSIARRHKDGDGDGDGGIGSNGASVVATSGNYIFAKRMGTVRGTDFQRTGEVTRVDARGIKKKLAQGDIVLLSSLGFNAAGEVLNCQSFDVALATAIDLKADKLIVMTDPSHMPYEGSHGVGERVPRFLSLRSAEQYLAKTYAAKESSKVGVNGSSSWRWLQMDYMIDGSDAVDVNASMDVRAEHMFDNMRGVNDSISRFEAIMERDLTWRVPHCPQELSLATFACKAGVRRAHLVDPTVSGSLLVELYTRDGIGCMVARDRYEGMRLASMADWESIKRILEPLVANGAVIERSDEDLIDEVNKGYFHVTERDGKVIACCALKPCGSNGDAHEVAAFAVLPEYRRGGRGDALLEYAENYAVETLGASNLFLLTTRTADWFVQRGFENKGLAEGNDELPPGKTVQSGRGSILFVKYI